MLAYSHLWLDALQFQSEHVPQRRRRINHTRDICERDGRVDGNPYLTGKRPSINGSADDELEKGEGTRC